jgi:leucyl-tRNA synthetase
MVGRGVEGANRFLRRVWNFGYAQRQRSGRAGGGAAATRATRRSLRREVHKLLQQADYDLSASSTTPWCRPAMKMLNALESAKLDETRASTALIAEGFSIFLRVLNPVAPHITHVLWQELGYAGEFGDMLDAPGRRSIRPRWNSPRSR